MIQKLRTLQNSFARPLGVCAVSLVMLSMASCGGSSGSDSDDPASVSGTWSGALTKTTDSCPGLGLPQVVNFNDVVIEGGGDSVELTTNDGTKYLGNIVGGNGFSVDATIPDSSGCAQTRRIEYDQVNDDDDGNASVEFNISRTCNGATCEAQYTGTASRAGVAAPTPTAPPGATATPPSTTTPIAGGCAAMNPATASGTFAGDGGCGISDSALSFGSQEGNQTVVLNPFGANGLTSFVISSANTSAASSIRTDLDIKGDVGYSCSMVCSPPGTFTVTCNKEGGTQCVEKF